MKRLLSCLAVLCMLFSVACAESAAALDAMYKDAELLMVQGDYTGAASKFEAMGAYADASQMAMYCKAVSAAEALGMYEIAIDAFADLDDFKDSKQMAQYYLGRLHESKGDSRNTETALDTDLAGAVSNYNDAIAVYMELALFKDSMTRISDCQTKITAVEQELAARKAARNENAYQEAAALEAAGRYREAVIAYQKLDGYKDSAARILACQDAITEETYQQALALENEGKYEEAITVYNEIKAYKDCADRIIACQDAIEAIQEGIYQTAYALEREHKYSEAITVYETIIEYSDSKNRIALCKEGSIPVEDIGEFHEGLLYVMRNGKGGFVDTNGTPAILCQYDDIYTNFNAGYAVVVMNQKAGVIDRNGKKILPTKYDYAYLYKETPILIKDNNMVGFADETGELIVPFTYEAANQFSEGYASVCLDNKYGLINANGELVVPCIYENATIFKDGCVAVKQNGKWGFIDAAGNTVIPFEYDNANGFSNGIAAVSVGNNNWGYINRKGELIVPCQYKYADIPPQNEGYIKIQDNGKYGFIDSSGTVVVPCEYEATHRFINGYTAVKKDGKWGLIDTNNVVVMPFILGDEEIVSSQRGIVKIKRNEKYGFVDCNGTVIIPCEYEKAYLSEGYFSLLKNGEVTTVAFDVLLPGYNDVLAAKAEQQKLLKEYTDKETVQQVQAALNEAGYDCGKPDGIAGKGTAAAVTQYQTDNSLNATGAITHELLMHLGLAA